ncbi:MAG TPA: vWA domain-containing protein [Bacteriovoracaceae bacterium]|nr:vWA domain-containing protein [Bacteriovoracaceae bacterium]
MKLCSKALLSVVLLGFLAGCGGEKFGTTPQSTTNKPDPLKAFEQLSCSSSTLIKPKVDILYVVDNSTSSYYLPSDIKTAIKKTVDSISKEFDYRMIGTNLIPFNNDPNAFDDYQVMTNSTDALSAEAASRKIITTSELNFFSNPAGGSNEAGLKRTIDFINSHFYDNLFRKDAYHIIVLISNGRDGEVERDLGYGNGQTELVVQQYNDRLASFNDIKNNLNSQQLRFFSVSAKSSCKPGWLSSNLSYVKMAGDLYNASGAQDNNANRDSYDLCGAGIEGLFIAVNTSIKQVILPHKYRYWPITFTSGEIEQSSIRVYKTAGNSAPVLMNDSEWDYKPNLNSSSINTRIAPTPGEPTTARHLIEFTPGNEIVYPTCISVASTSKREFFGFVVIPKEPKPESIAMRINGQTIAQSSSNGWSYIGNRMNQNIKVAYPNSGDELPAVVKSGFMIQLNGSASYYKSGDNVEVHYIPAGI